MHCFGVNLVVSVIIDHAILIDVVIVVWPGEINFNKRFYQNGEFVFEMSGIYLLAAYLQSVVTSEQSHWRW